MDKLPDYIYLNRELRWVLDKSGISGYVGLTTDAIAQHLIEEIVILKQTLEKLPKEIVNV